MKRLVLLAFALGLTACATPKYNYVPNKIDVSEPPIGSVQTAYVGDQLLRQGKYSEHDAILLKDKVDFSFSAYTLTPGYYIKHGEDQTSGFYIPSGESDGGRVDKAVLADPWISIQAYNDGSKLCVVTVFHAVTCEDNVPFKQLRKPVFSSDSFQQTLIYSGKVGAKINIGYREFSGNIARPGFNNDVEYDLNESKVIGYKGARLEILEATNDHIKYKVLANFNNAAL